MAKKAQPRQAARNCGDRKDFDDPGFAPQGEKQSEIQPASAGTETPAPGIGDVKMHPTGPSTPKMCAPVAYRGSMGPAGNRPEKSRVA